MNSQANFVLTLSCGDRKGIVAAVANCIASQGCNICESAQYGDPETLRFFMRVSFAAPEGMTREQFVEGFRPVATAYDFDWEVHDLSRKPRVLIMVSKMGHCLNDLLYRNGTGQLRMDLVGVASNHETWRSRVEHEKLPFHYLPVTKDTKKEQEAQILELVEREKIDLVILARYMQILSDDLSQALAGKVINIHHSFLPSFIGARPYHRAHARGVKMVGATAHYVTADLDEGPIIEQDVSRVEHAHTVEELIAQGRDTESQVLARAVKYHLDHRILLNGDRTVIFK
ncbi:MULTISPECIES: formyltetrahydrofolate deformylase [Pseudovibrio]|uniref:formyltetrahydrofolate deformylase n=1 Tax=Stappiaceae TaxID=2821832 RepID=UPI00236548F4|nr:MULTISPECIES: formyltetrahydrofolate deformylase [Pseudovibrio]MDD7910735.1 formyltetrahydrofolate deformylase [Pseudovibrio exalbescens]MDX5593556.1 formyltetrahydrofolate deformylase [Pseudovibrio sp. SPO723]